jgi:hypothetical protein
MSAMTHSEIGWRDMLEMIVLEIAWVATSYWVIRLLEGMSNAPLIMLSENVANENAQHHTQRKLLDLSHLIRRKVK